MSTVERRRWRIRLCTLAMCWLGVSTAGAQDVPFAVVLRNGWRVFSASAGLRADHQIFTWYARVRMHAVVNGQIGPDIGQAYIQAFMRAVPDPNFGGIPPIAGLITLHHPAFRAHLTVFDTPAGLRTTIGLMDTHETVDTRVSGTWVFGSGPAVGGTADDMVVGGVVHFGTPTAATSLTVNLAPYVPPVPYAFDQPFVAALLTANPLAWPSMVSASYNVSQYGPIRMYMRSDWGQLADDFTGIVTVLHTGGDNYATMACTWFHGVQTQVDNDMRPCTLGGTGLLTRLAGRATAYAIESFGRRTTTWQASFAP